MEDREIEPLVAAMERRLVATECDLHRSLYGQIDWDDRLVCIKGGKGTGKTTMMLQFLKEHPSELDNNGGGRLFVDEVHHRRNWQTLIKNVFDDYPKLQIIYSGSSSGSLTFIPSRTS